LAIVRRCPALLRRTPIAVNGRQCPCENLAMLERAEADLIAYLSDQSGQAVFVLREAGDEATAMSALRHAADAVRAIPHPDEPDDPLPNWVDAISGDDGPSLHLDMQDHGEQAAQVVAAMVAALEESGIDGRFEPLRPPPPPFDYDPQADIMPGVNFLTELDERGLPPAFPDGFPAPAGGVLVIAQRAMRGQWEHAAWRRNRPFDEYPDDLRRAGYDLESVAGADPIAGGVDIPDIARYLLRRSAGTGSVALYHEDRSVAAPTRWYVNVVWPRVP
jgi:hypothetical protein